MKARSILLGTLLFGLSFFTCAATPARIVSLMPAYTEAVCLLGGCDRLVGTDNYSDWPLSIQKLPKLGGMEDSSIEAIVRLGPDLVLSHPSGRLNTRLKALGLRVIELPSETLADIQSLLVHIEEALMQDPLMTKRSPAVWSQAMHSIERLKRPEFSRLKVYMEVDSALYAAGPSSYLGELLHRLGAHNIVSQELGLSSGLGSASHFPKLSPEFVLRQNPTLIMQLHSGTDSSSGFSMQQRPGWQRLQAIHLNKVCRWSSKELNVLLRPGPRIEQAVELLAACLQRGL